MGKTTVKAPLKRDYNKHLPAEIAFKFVVTDAPGVAFTDKQLGHVDLTILTEKKAKALIATGVKWISEKPKEN